METMDQEKLGNPIVSYKSIAGKQHSQQGLCEKKGKSVSEGVFCFAKPSSNKEIKERNRMHQVNIGCQQPPTLLIIVRDVGCVFVRIVFHDSLSPKGC
jgi:hypothetical protein